VTTVGGGTERTEDDVLLAVVGVPAAEIVARCRAVRRGDPVDVRRRVTRGTAAYRLVDFADVSDENFVQLAHRVLLGRPAAPAEVGRRLGDLRSGTPRFAIVVRLALSPEGRIAPRSRSSGIWLPLLRWVGVAIEAARANPRAARAVAWVEARARRLFASHRSAS
jgi:hypothetical protein